MTLTKTANTNYQKPSQNSEGEEVITHRYLGSYDYAAHQAQQQKPSIKL
jgi:hypothetical protein|tara:strand:- start:216 stop:362 length:147 start_codon:yes stop_codon:yes gene_type:complete